MHLVARHDERHKIAAGELGEGGAVAAWVVGVVKGQGSAAAFGVAPWVEQHPQHFGPFHEHRVDVSAPGKHGVQRISGGGICGRLRRVSRFKYQVIGPVSSNGQVLTVKY